MSNEGDCGRGKGQLHFYSLPEDCIATVISLTGPGDASKLSVLSKVLRSIADSDSVWKTFLPPDCDAEVPEELLQLSKKQLFLYLCDHPILLDGGKKSFSLDKWSGNKCCMLSARDLAIVWGDSPSYWKWTSLPESRFPEVAEMIGVCWLEIHGKICTSWLSEGTHYAAYLVFKLMPGAFGLEHQPVKVKFGIVGREMSKRNVYLDMKGGPRQRPQMRTSHHHHHGTQRSREVEAYYRRHSYWLPRMRGDGWCEVELGEFFNNGGLKEELEMSVLETKGGNWKGGLILQGIEIRPKGLLN